MTEDLFTSRSSGFAPVKAVQSHAGVKLSDDQRLDWLRLFRSENIGPRTFQMLINRFGGAGAALAALPELSKQRGREIVICPLADAEREMEIAHRFGARFIARGESDYPALLAAVDAGPPLIAVRGRAEVFQSPFVAIVGSRNASAIGMRMAENLAHGLNEAGLAIVSGLARGIDTRAHQASIAFGTVAVLAGGLDKPYPPENLKLLDELCERGAVIAEMPFGWEPRGRDFPRRNRIISGLAFGTVIVEAARKSGSLITAKFALEQNREVFAVPGSPLDPRADGTNDLIRQGATLVTRAQDIVDVLAPIVSHGLPPADTFMGDDGHHAGIDERLWDELDLPGIADAPQVNFPLADAFEEQPAAFVPALAEGSSSSARNYQDITTARERILSALGPVPVEVDELVRATDVNMRDAFSILLDLELEDKVLRHNGGRVSTKQTG